MNQRQGHGQPTLTQGYEEWSLARVVQLNGQATVAHIAEEVNADSDRKMSEYKVHSSLFSYGFS